MGSWKIMAISRPRSLRIPSPAIAARLIARGNAIARNFEPSPAAATRAVRLKTHQPEREHGLTAAGLTDQAQHLAFLDSKGHFVYGLDPAIGRRQFHFEILEFEKRSHEAMIIVWREPARILALEFSMTQMKCPKCGAAMIPAMGRSYCSQCGWNRTAAERRLVRVRWLAPALIVIFDLMGIIGLGIRDHNWAGAILLATLPVLLLGVVFAGATQGLRQLRGQIRGPTTVSQPRKTFARKTTQSTATPKKKSSCCRFLRRAR